MSRETISGNELDTLPRSELNDELILDIASRTFNVSTYHLIFAALFTKRGNAHSAHTEEIYWTFWITGRVPHDVRRYCIECLLGQAVMLIDQDRKQGILLA